MEIIYALESPPDKITKSIFLAGPTPRTAEVDSWRTEALEILEKLGFDGTVFIPEPRDQKWHNNYDRQVNWEEDFLNMADCIVFWVPRDLETMPAFTTNVEFGAWCESGKIVFGAPPDAPKNTYLKHYAEKYKAPTSESLEDTLAAAIKMLGDGVERKDGEVTVPLFIWKTPSFQSWYKQLREAGNILQHATLLWSFRHGHKSFVFLWILSAAIYVTSEKRSKTNEIVLSRTDITSVCMYYDVPDSESIFDKEIVLIKEFRSPSNTEDGFIRELPGGSSFKSNLSLEEVALTEVSEETGLQLDPSRLVKLDSRQLCGTLSAHKSYLYSYQLNDDEIKWLRSQEGISHGQANDTEKTFVEVYPLKHLLENPLTDWVTLGQILSVLNISD